MKSCCFLFVAFCSALFFNLPTLCAQSGACYVRLKDASGHEPSAAQVEALEQAAAALCAVFDSAGFGGQFKVYDFGFYLHHETTAGGYPEPFARKVEEVAALSPYYLLFGREANGQGTSQRFWVEAGLPDSGIFYCINQLSPALRDNLSKKYGIIANEIHRLGAERPENKFHLAEIGTMDSLRTYIFDLMDCCDGEQRAVSPSCNACVFTYSQISQNLLDAGFATTTPLTQFDTITSTGISASIDGRTNLILDIGGDSIELDKHASGIAERYMANNPDNTIKIFLRNFSDVCINFDATLTQFRADNSDAKVLMVAIPDDGGSKIRLHFLSEGDLRVDNVSADDFIKGYPDHYFDLAGNYLGQDRAGFGRIRVVNKPLNQVPNLIKDIGNKIVNKTAGEENSVNLSDHVQFEYHWKRDPQQMFSNIALYYGKDMGILYKIVIDTAFNGTAKSSYLTKTIIFNDNPTINGGYNSYNQMLSILYHEHMHIQSKRGDDSDPCGHVEYAYISQMMHKETFFNCSEAFRLQILGLCSCYLINCMSEPSYKGGGKENFEKMYDKIKEIYKGYGFFFTIYKYETNAIRYIIKKIKNNQLITDKECGGTINH